MEEVQVGIFRAFRSRVILPEGSPHAPSLIKKTLLCLNIPPAPPAIMLSRWYQPPLQALTLLSVFKQESPCLACSWRHILGGTRWLKGRRWSLSALWPKAPGKPRSLGTERTRGRLWGGKVSAPREPSWRPPLSGRATPGATTAQLTTATASSRARQ